MYKLLLAEVGSSRWFEFIFLSGLFRQQTHTQRKSVYMFFFRCIFFLWWRLDMGTPSALLALCEGNHWSPVDSHHRGPKYCVAVIFSLLPTWQSCCTNSRFTGDLRRLYPHVTLLWCYFSAACRWRFSPVWMDSLWLVICVAQVIYSNAWPLH